MAFTIDDIDALKRAIASGALSVEYADGSKVQYRSLREMREIQRMMESEVAASPISKPSRSFLVGF